MSAQQTSVVIIGGGPGGYEAALVAAQLGARVTLVERDGLGGAAVLTDCVPSKALIAVAERMVRLDGGPAPALDLAAVNDDILELAAAQSSDITARLVEVGVEIIAGTGRLVDAATVAVAGEDGERILAADVVLVATGAIPRVLRGSAPDGERILTWQDIYGLRELPERLVVVGSGVTGAELAQAYLGLGSQVVLVSSRDHVLPGEDPDAAMVIEEVFTERGMTVLSRSRMARVRRHRGGVVVDLEDGREVEGTHALLAVGSVPQTSGMGLVEAGVRLTESGHIAVDRVSRTSVRGVYAAGDCTGILPLASVAAVQGRTAMAHALGDAVAPLPLHYVSANIFTDPEIATVGVSQKDVDSGRVSADVVTLPLARNPRAKMAGITRGFVKLFAHRGSGTVLGGVVVGPRASELVFPVTLAVTHRLNVDQVASSFTVYPSLTGSIAEAARRLHPRE